MEIGGAPMQPCLLGLFVSSLSWGDRRQYVHTYTHGMQPEPVYLKRHTSTELLYSGADQPSYVSGNMSNTCNQQASSRCNQAHKSLVRRKMMPRLPLVELHGRRLIDANATYLLCLYAVAVSVERSSTANQPSSPPNRTEYGMPQHALVAIQTDVAAYVPNPFPWCVVVTGMPLAAWPGVPDRVFVSEGVRLHRENPTIGAIEGGQRKMQDDEKGHNVFSAMHAWRGWGGATVIGCRKGKPSRRAEQENDRDGMGFNNACCHLLVLDKAD